MGIVTCSSKTLMGQRLTPKIKMVQANIGAVASPFDCWLILRGLHTLQLRLERQFHTAMELALFLEDIQKQQDHHNPPHSDIHLNSHPSSW